MKRTLLTVIAVLCSAVAALAQDTPFSTFSVTTAAISLPGGRSTVAGTEAGAMLRVTQNTSIGTMNVISPGTLSYYSGRFEQHIPFLSKKLNNISPTINGLQFDIGVTGSAGVVRVPVGSDFKQHYGFTGGVFVNYYLNKTWSLGVEAQYAKFPGYNNNTATVAFSPAIHF